MSTVIPFGQLHVDKHLTNFALNYESTVGWAERVFPIVPVNKESDLYPVDSQADLLRIKDTTAGRGAEMNRVNYSVSSDSYRATKYGLRADITQEDMANADPNFRRLLETDLTRMLLDDLKRDYDRRVAVQLTNASNVGTASNVASAWSDRSNSDPYGDINAVIDHVHYGTTYRPNSMLIGNKALDNLTRNNNIIDKVNATAITGGDQDAKVAQIKQLFRLDDVIVAEGFYNSAAEGQPAVLEEVFGDHVLLYYKTPTPSLIRPTFGATFRWQHPALPRAMGVQRIPFNMEIGAMGLQAGYYQDEKITSAALAGLISWTDSSQ
jgi:hypothetical protein